MTTNATVIHILMNLLQSKEPVLLATLHWQMPLVAETSYAEVSSRINELGYIEIKGNWVYPSEKGKKFIEELEKKELQKISKLIPTSYDLALIQFLYDRNDYVHLHDFPEILVKSAPQYGNAVNYGNLIQRLFKLKGYIDEKHEWYIINDTGKSICDQQLGKYSSGSGKAGEGLGSNQSKYAHLVIPAISEAERAWLKELYDRTFAGDKFSYRQLWSSLDGKLPDDFNPGAVDALLMSDNGELIRIMGVVVVEGNFSIIDDINSIIYSIKKLILKDDSITELAIDEIADACSINRNRVSVALELARHYLFLYSSASFEENSTELKSINISGNEEVFNKYLHFKGIEHSILTASKKHTKDPREYFTPKEVVEVNSKLDWLMKEMKKVTLSNEFTYNDVMAELEEMRSLLGLSKKNWGRILAAKLAEMTAGGIVSNVISEPFADIINPEIHRFITQ